MDRTPGSCVGTEAVLHQLDAADVVAFLDLDQELLAPRYRAAEEALGLLVRGARLVGGRAGGGRLLLQTRLPDHEVVQAALLADPVRVAAVEAARRAELALSTDDGHGGGVRCVGPRLGRRRSRPPAAVSRCSAPPTVAGCCGPRTTARSATPSHRCPGRPAGSAIEVDPLRL